MTPAANDLFLTSIHNGSTYPMRKHAATKMVQGYYSSEDFVSECRFIIDDEAKASRAKFGSKYKAKDITEAAGELAAYMVAHVRECIAGEYDATRPVLAAISRWFDKAAGNSYFSVMVQVPQNGGHYTLYKIRTQYGYGSQPEWETINELIGLGLFEHKGRTGHQPSAYPVEFTDRGYMLKRDL